MLRGFYPREGVTTLPSVPGQEFSTVAVDLPQGLPCRFHSGFNVPLAPSSDISKILRLLPESYRKLIAVVAGGDAARVALPWIAKHVSSLKCLAVTCLQEREVLREM